MLGDLTNDVSICFFQGHRWRTADPLCYEKKNKFDWLTISRTLFNPNDFPQTLLITGENGGVVEAAVGWLYVWVWVWVCGCWCEGVGVSVWEEGTQVTVNTLVMSRPVARGHCHYST